MKKYQKIITAIAAIAITASCTDNLQVGSNLVRFGAGTGVSTKTSYSGEQIDGRERVDWVTGDEIQIYCYECPEPAAHMCDYTIAGQISTSGYYSLSNIELRAGDSGLRWADDDELLHHFYAITPSNHANGTVSQHYYGDTGLCDFSATIPASQAPVSVSADAAGNYTAAPDMKNLIMVANADYRRSEIVNLDFTPVVTAVEFTIQNGYLDEGDMVISAIKLRSSQRDIVGRFTEYYGEDYASFSSAGREVTIPFSNPVTVSYGKTLKFTVFMLGEDPKPIDNMTIEFVKDATTSISAQLKTSQGGMEFPRSKKSYVSGLIVPGACVWTISAEPDVVVPWNEVPTQDIDLTPANAYLLPGVFTIGGGKKVRFSKGNLQAVLENGVITKWQFAEHQWETANDISSLANETGVIDKFRPSTTAPLNRWGTHIGFSEAIDPSWGNSDHMFQSEPAIQFFNDHYVGTVIPQWTNSDFVSEYGGGWDIFGGPYTTGTDPSFYNCLMTFINKEYGSHGSYTDYYEPHCTPASIGSVNGVMLLPDDFVQPEGISVEWPDNIVYYSGGSGAFSYEPSCNNNYTQAQWEQMEAAGAVFLPVGGYGVISSGEGVLIDSYPYLPSTAGGYHHYIDANFLAGEPDIDGIGMIRLIQVVE